MKLRLLAASLVVMFGVASLAISPASATAEETVEVSLSCEAVTVTVTDEVEKGSLVMPLDVIVGELSKDSLEALESAPGVFIVTWTFDTPLVTGTYTVTVDGQVIAPQTVSKTVECEEEPPTPTTVPTPTTAAPPPPTPTTVPTPTTSPRPRVEVLSQEVVAPTPTATPRPTTLAYTGNNTTLVLALVGSALLWVGFFLLRRFKRT